MSARRSDFASVTSTLRESFAALTAGEVTARGFSFFAVLLLARRLGPTDFGAITLATTLVAWFGLVADSGTELVGVRDVAREPAEVRTVCDRVLGLRLAVSLVAAAVYVVAVSQLVSSSHTRSVLVLFALVLPANALNVRWMVLGVGGGRAIAAGNVVSKIFLLVGVAALVAGPDDLHRVPYLFFGAELAYGLVILAILSRRLGFIVPAFDAAAWIHTLRQGLPLLVVSIVRATSFSIDVVVVAVLLGSHAVGLYGAASKPVLFATSAIGLFSVAFLSAYSGASGSDANELLRKSLRPLIGCALLAAIVLSAGATIVLPLLFGHTYAAAVPVLVLLAWRIPVTAIGSPYGTILIARHRQRVLLRNNVVGAVLGAAGCLSLAPVGGITGVAAARVAAAVVTAVLNYRSSTTLGLAPPLDPRRRAAIAGVLDA